MYMQYVQLYVLTTVIKFAMWSILKLTINSEDVSISVNN